MTDVVPDKVKTKFLKTIAAGRFGEPVGRLSKPASQDCELKMTPAEVTVVCLHF